jgi:DNA-binding beta-propeller fold protein YncE
MWDTATLTPIKTIPVEGSPDGILFDPATEHVFVFSHRAPNATVIDAKDGSIVGTCDLGGAPEQAASDGKGRIYIDLEDQDTIAVLDAHTLKVIARYPLAGQGGEPAGLALDSKNHVLFASCRNPAAMVMLDAETGKILATLPIGAKTDGALFNAATGEAFSSSREGTLTVIKGTGATAFNVEENVTTLPGARTCTLDAKTNRILLITADYGPVPAINPPAVSGSTPAGKPKGPARAPMIPDSFRILAVGKAGA